MNTEPKQSAMEFLESLAGEKLTFSSLLKSIRIGDEISQVEFSKILGISKQKLCDIENNRRNVSPKRAAEFADILGYSKKQFVRLCLQDQLDRDGLDLTVQIDSVA